MILWCDGAHGAAENMRRDRALLERFDAGGGERPPAVLRLFAFERPGVTLGYAQQAARTLDLARCRAEGIDWAVRPTGGRAILHVDEWTYSLSAALDDPEWGGSLAQAYARASGLILASLARLGAPVILAGRSRGGARAAGDGRAAACFASAARHEILLGGRKLVGSAQRRTSTGLLQQGSVLLGPGHLRLPDLLALPPERREAERAALAAGSTYATTLAGMPLACWADALHAELGGRARRVDGASGAFLLTGREIDSYTRQSP